MYKGKGFDKPRAYGKCKPPCREDYVLAIFQKIEGKLSRALCALSELASWENTCLDYAY